MYWAPLDTWEAGDAGPAQRTPNIAAVIEEIVGRSGWAAGNALMLVVTGFNEGENRRKAWSRDGNPSAAPVLTVQWTTGSTTTTEVRTSHSHEDAEENSSGVVMLGSTKLELVDHYAFNDIVTALHFSDVAIPSGATVTNAWVQFSVGAVDSGLVNLEIAGENAGYSAWFTASHYSLSGRNWTNERVIWNPPDTWTSVGTHGFDQRTPNLASILNAIVSRGNWQSGNALSLFFSGFDQGPNRRRAWSYDGNYDARPTLHVEYTMNGVGPLTPRLMSYNTRWVGLPWPWESRSDDVIAVIGAYDPDVLGLQEVYEGDEAHTDILNAYPYFGSYQFDNRSQVILWDENKYFMDDSGGFVLSDPRSDMTGADRKCSWVHLTDRTTGQGFYVYNVHLDGRVLEAQSLAVVRLMEGVEARPIQSDPFVITGDYNAREWIQPMKWLRGEIYLPNDDDEWVKNTTPLVDTFRVLYPDAINVGTAGGLYCDPTGNKIDYVMVEASTTVLHAEIDRTSYEPLCPSDHFPVNAVPEW